MFRSLLLLLMCSLAVSAHGKHYELFTDLGTIYIETFDEEAPITTENFATYVADDFYKHLIFHRVIDDFMIQTGGVNTVLDTPETRDPIENESRNGLKNIRGTLAMARWSDPDSADSQFYINLQANPHLDPTEESLGYTVFAQVDCGMAVVDAIAKEPVRQFETYQHLPANPVRLIWIKEIESDNHGYTQCKHQQNSIDS